MVIGRAKNSARHRFCFVPRGIRAGFEPFGACGNIYGSKPARFNSVKNECCGRAEFFALPITNYLSVFTFHLSPSSLCDFASLREILARDLLQNPALSFAISSAFPRQPTNG